MKVLEGQITYSSFLERVQNASSRVLLLDYDGTLAPFSTDRNRAFPYPEVPPLIEQIMGRETRVVLISGRPARDLVMLSGLYPHPEIWGSHGLERLMPDGTYSVQKLPSEQETGLLDIADRLRKDGLEANLELKPGGVAVHWRGLAPKEIESLRQRLLRHWNGQNGSSLLELVEFDGGLEVRVPGVNKGNAVNSILGESHPDAVIAYLGDDMTDEDAFRALKDRGLAVLVRPESRPSAADLWLKPPQELVDFLQRWLNACGGKA